MGLLRDDFKPTKCDKCKKVAIKLVKEQVPVHILNRYPEGICRRCKTKLLKSLRGVLK